MKRVKWIELNIQLDFPSAIKRLSLDTYTEDKGKGFVFEKIRNNLAYGRFIEKLTVYDTFINIDGYQSTNERIEYRTTQFTISIDKLPIIQLINPPRTLKPFAQALVKNLGFGVSLEEIDVDPIKWANAIAEHVNLTVMQLDISRVKISNDATAKMQIVGSNDLMSYYNRELTLKKVHTDKVTCGITSLACNGKLKLTNNGLAYIDVKSENDFIDIIFTSLIKATSI